MIVGTGRVRVRRQDPAVEVFILARLRLISATRRLMRAAGSRIAAAAEKATIVSANVSITGIAVRPAAASRSGTMG
jgi:hypothetical protein